MSVAANATPMLDAEQLAILVDRFYEKVRADVLLGAVFNPVVHDWEAHKRLLTSFWVGVVLRAGTYRAILWGCIARTRSDANILPAGWRCGRKPAVKSSTLARRRS